jgi:hypothetical protein
MVKEPSRVKQLSLFHLCNCCKCVELRNTFLGKKYLNSFMRIRIRDPESFWVLRYSHKLPSSQEKGVGGFQSCEGFFDLDC